MSARMYARFKITAEEILKLVHAIEMGEGKMTPINFDTGKTKVYKSLNFFTTGVANEAEVIDGTKLQNYVFPTGIDGQYHVFISHSHDDKDIAIMLATFLQEKCHLKVFLDSYVWKSADGLLRKIDDEYCKQKDGKYNYYRRNFSTAHIHAMLSMAIMDIINKTECCIFIESNHSIKLSKLKNASNAKTLSPWIYEEYAMMRALPRHRTGERLKQFAKADGVTESREFKAAYDVKLASFMPLQSNDLVLLREGEKALEDLYAQYDKYEEHLLVKEYGIQD